MAYEWQQWQDHVTEHENRYREIENDDGTITHEAVEGEVLQQGTPQSATNFNHMEDGITNAGELAALLATETIHMNQRAADETGETILLTLTNGQQYPFNVQDCAYRKRKGSQAESVCEGGLLLMKGANVIIRSEERKQHEAYVLQSFGVKGRGTPEQREAAEVIAARTREVVKEGGR